MEWKEKMYSFRDMFFMNLVLASFFSSIISVFAYFITLGDYNTAISVFITFWWLIFFVGFIISLLPVPKLICKTIE